MLGILPGVRWPCSFRWTTTMRLAAKFIMGAIVAVTLLSSDRADASFQTGNSLLDACVSTQSYPAAICLNYISGVADAASALYPAAYLGWRFCIPNTATLGQLKEVVTRWLIENPGERHYTGNSLVAHALSERFPCAPAPAVTPPPTAIPNQSSNPFSK